MSFGREAATYYPCMQEIAEGARLKYFADLRPNYTYTELVDSPESEQVVDVVALAVQEYPSQSSNDELVRFRNIHHNHPTTSLCSSTTCSNSTRGAGSLTTGATPTTLGARSPTLTDFRASSGRN
jgi:hypothetical protein